jgi:hypothetical protein
MYKANVYTVLKTFPQPWTRCSYEIGTDLEGKGNLLPWSGVSLKSLTSLDLLKSGVLLISGLIPNSDQPVLLYTPRTITILRTTNQSDQNTPLKHREENYNLCP